MKKLTLKEVKDIIPHRWPFLLITSFIVIDGDKAVTGKKFGFLWWLICKLGHFAMFPIVPGAVFMELCAQVCAVLAIAKDESLRGNLTILRGGKFSFSRPFQPFDIANVQVTFRCEKLGVLFFDCIVFDNYGRTYSEIEIKGSSVTPKQFEATLNNAPTD